MAANCFALLVYVFVDAAHYTNVLRQYFVTLTSGMNGYFSQTAPTWVQRSARQMLFIYPLTYVMYKRLMIV